jgi:hypothetical protein
MSAVECRNREDHHRRKPPRERYERATEGEIGGENAERLRIEAAGEGRLNGELVEPDLAERIERDRFRGHDLARYRSLRNCGLTR